VTVPDLHEQAGGDDAIFAALHQVVAYDQVEALAGDGAADASRHDAAPLGRGPPVHAAIVLAQAQPDHGPKAPNVSAGVGR